MLPRMMTGDEKCLLSKRVQEKKNDRTLKVDIVICHMIKVIVMIIFATNKT